jgi:hypothetical protein
VSHSADHLRPIEDYPIVGGCARCEATQELFPDRVHRDIFWLKITHAVGCAFLARVRAARWN